MARRGTRRRGTRRRGTRRRGTRRRSQARPWARPACPPMRRYPACRRPSPRMQAMGTPASGPAVCGLRTRPACRAGPLLGLTSPDQQFPAIPPGPTPLRSMHRSRPRTPAPAPHGRRTARFPHRPHPWAAGQAVPSSPGSSTAVEAHMQPPARPRVRRPPGTTLRQPRPSPAKAAFRVRSRAPRMDRRFRPGHQPAPRRHPAGLRPHPAT
jgi:hypothetical protein